MTTFTIRFDDRTHQALRKLADAEDLSYADTLRRIIRREAKKLDQNLESGTTAMVAEKGGASDQHE